MSAALSDEDMARAKALLPPDALRKLERSLKDGSISPAAARLAFGVAERAEHEDLLRNIPRAVVFLTAAGYFTDEWRRRARCAVETRSRKAAGLKEG